MAKKPRAMNKKMIAIGGGIIIVLGLLLVGTYGNNLKTQSIVPGESRPINSGEGSAACIEARNTYANEAEIFRQSCTPTILLPVPQGPSQRCLNAFEALLAAEKAVYKVCGMPVRPIYLPTDTFSPPAPSSSYFTPPPAPYFPHAQPPFKILQPPLDLHL